MQGALWCFGSFLTNPDLRTPTFLTPFQGSKKVKKLAQLVGSIMQKFVHGVNELHVCLDDLLISARSQQMSDNGYSIGMNEKKASGTGHSIDIATLTVRLHLVGGIIVTDASDRRAGLTRTNRIESFFQELKQQSSANRTITFVDRDYENAVPALVGTGVDVVGTSQRGSVYRKSTPFTYGPARMSDETRQSMKILSADNREGLSMTHWATNTIAGREFHHVAVEGNKGRPPVLAKNLIS